MDDSHALVPVVPSVEIGGATLLGKLFPALRDADPIKAEQDMIELMRSATELGPLLGFDPNTREGATRSLKAVFELTNLGLDRASSSREEEASRIIAKNPARKLYEIGRGLARDVTREAAELWERSVMGDRDAGYVGLLPLARENELIRLKSFAVCATMEELARHRATLEEIKILLEIARHLPVSLVFGKPVIVQTADFIRTTFRRLSREEPSPRGGVLPIFMRTLFVKALLGTYRCYNDRIPDDYCGSKNWRLYRDELAAFLKLARAGDDVLQTRIEKAMMFFEAYFLKEARDIGAPILHEKKRLRAWLPFFDAHLRELVTQVHEFYGSSTDAHLVDEKVDAFWADKIILGELGMFLHAAPPVSHLLKLSLSDLRKPIQGFASWPRDAQRTFVDQYPFTERLTMKRDDVRVAEYFVEVLGVLASAHDATQSETAYGERALARTRFNEVSLLVTYRLFASGPAWVKEKILRTAPLIDVTSRGLVDLFTSQRFVSNDYADGRLLTALLDVARADAPISGRRWETLLEYVALSSAFPHYYRLCPFAARVAALQSLSEIERHPALGTLSPQELIDLITVVNPKKAATLPPNLSLRVLTATACHQFSDCMQFHLVP